MPGIPLITFDDGTNNEICKVSRSGNTLIIVRAQESTTARAFSSGDSASGRVTAEFLNRSKKTLQQPNQTVFNTTSGGATTYNIGTNPGLKPTLWCS